MMPGRKRVLIIALFSLFSIFCETAPAEEGFISLFNGKDLNGWRAIGTAEAFAVKNRSIYTTGASPYPSWLCSNEQYENFVLRFEYMTDGWYEGGILLHAPVHGPTSKLGMKLHLRHDQKEYGARSPGAIYDVAAPLAIANRPSKKWNQCEITCNWPTLRVTMNGILIHNIDMNVHDALKYRLRQGHIGIQNIGCRAYFRNIEIRKLPDKEKWTNLFAQGMDGLRLVEETDWSLKGDLLTGKGKNGFAVTKQEFSGPFEFQVWAKTVVNGNGGVHFYWQDRNHGIEVQCFNSPDSTNPTGSLYGIAPAKRIASFDEQWFLLQVFADGPNAMVIVNGEQVSKTNKLKPPYKGGLGFQQHTPGTTIWYRGARVKKIKWR
jgi:hypothetical protein